MEFYIWHPYGRVSEVTEALLACRENVALKLNYSSTMREVGGFSHFQPQKRVMRDAGIKVVPALPR